MPEVLKIKDGPNWVAVGEEVAIGPTQPTKGQEIWIDTNPASNAGIPPGVIVSFAATNAPAGWLLCNGAAVSRTVYADLFAAIGTAYGSGDGSSTFNVPNIAGQVLVNRDTTQTEFNGIGKTGGAKTHTLTVAEMPAHNHSGTSGAGWTDFMRIVGGVGTNAFANHLVGHGAGGYVDIQNTAAFPGGSHTHSIPSQGSGGAHNNLQPYFVVGAYIIKS